MWLFVVYFVFVLVFKKVFIVMKWVLLFWFDMLFSVVSFFLFNDKLSFCVINLLGFFLFVIFKVIVIIEVDIDLRCLGF